uniref:Uncharacterized protein n=1 Tax=Acanthochromis polyacanthus TaxID=80966 RepID=A0A3Q1EZF3_9TELE
EKKKPKTNNNSNVNGETTGAISSHLFGYLTVPKWAKVVWVEICSCRFCSTMQFWSTLAKKKNLIKMHLHIHPQGSDSQIYYSFMGCQRLFIRIPPNPPNKTDRQNKC